jgi:two-component system response regulator HydG
MKGLSILLVDDEPLMRLSMVDALEAVGYDVHAAASGTEGIEAIWQKHFDLVITDLRLPGADGLTVLKAAKDKASETEVVVITAHGSVETAVGAMKLGAVDYITKPFQMDELLLIVERIGRIVVLRRENQDLKAALEDKFSFSGILGANSRMRAVLDKIKLVAATDSTVLILGESGTGKELVANAVHQNSPRRDCPLIKVSCAALPETLLEAELFGHEKGAFTGATARKPGLVEAASGGTLFLDEVGDIPLAQQVKLLRLIETGTYRRVGGVTPLRADFRLVAATHRDLRRMAYEGRFRSDLYYRISAYPVHVPTLRERREDILMLAASLLARLHPGRRFHIAEAARHALVAYDYPGNVRELRNIVERASLLADGDRIELRHLPQEVVAAESAGSAPSAEAAATPSGKPLLTAERDALTHALSRHKGNRRELALSLGLSERTLYRKLRAYGLAKPRRGDSGG